MPANLSHLTLRCFFSFFISSSVIELVKYKPTYTINNIPTNKLNIKLVLTNNSSFSKTLLKDLYVLETLADILGELDGGF